jgi:hypothetical protein
VTVNCLRGYSLIFEEQFDSARAMLAEARAEWARASAQPEEIDMHCLNSEGQLLAVRGFPDSAIVLLRVELVRL